MAVAVRRIAFETPEFRVVVDLTYDDAKQVVIDEYDVDIRPCDLISVRLIVERDTATINIQRGQSRNWQTRTAEEGTDVTFSAGGPVRSVGDLDRYHVCGTT